MLVRWAEAVNAVQGRKSLASKSQAHLAWATMA
jgi:hypothetical protein